jgi:hypothetical protein
VRALVRVVCLVTVLVGCSAVPRVTEPPQQPFDGVIGRGVVDGVPWEAIAYVDGGQICTGVRQLPGHETGTSGACGSGLAPDHGILFTSLSGDPLVAHGVVREDVVRIRLETTRDDLDVDVVPLGAMGVPARAFAAAVPSDSDVESFVAFDAEGRELQRAIGPGTP